jgi:adenylate kinase family enzyme
MRRIVVVGTTGSGKTTLARTLGHALGLPHIELDSLHWEPGWREAETDVFRERVDGTLSGECWVVDGNYSVSRDLVWPRADTIVWLDYRLRRVYWRLLKRTLRRAASREDLWHTGNRENLWKHFFTRDSLFVWAYTSSRRRHRAYPALFMQPDYAHLNVLHFKTPRQTEAWLRNVLAITEGVEKHD